MPRYRDAEKIHPFMRAWMEREGYRTLKEASDATGLSMTTLCRYASGDPGYIDEIITAAGKMGMSPQDWVSGWLEHRNQETQKSI